MEAETIRTRLEAMVADFEIRANKDDRSVPAETIDVVQALLGAARAAVPNDPVVQAIAVVEKAKYSDLYPVLRQVVLALPAPLGIA